MTMLVHLQFDEQRKQGKDDHKEQNEVARTTRYAEICFSSRAYIREVLIGIHEEIREL